MVLSLRRLLNWLWIIFCLRGDFVYCNIGTDFGIDFVIALGATHFINY